MEKEKGISIIVAMTDEGVIGNRGNLPWKISEDLKLFKQITTGNTVIIGRKTFESFKVKPLPNRNNIVLSRDEFSFPGVSVCRSLEEGLNVARYYGREVFIAGGASVYSKALPLAARLYVSNINGKYEGDACFPQVDWNCWIEILARRKEFKDFTFKLYERKI
ncbi:hypothetical protein A3K73_07080 [Candidatus Pacearchaeota archaeon RBG_13_36_9]|nr:MAG: hypothetical protein A3K73_07080 [Candidatus Pacearchaeota archaeon RBG_13_36_9]